MLSVRCCVSLVAAGGVYSVEVQRLLIAVAFLAVELGLLVLGLQWLPLLGSSTVSVVVAYGLSCSKACGIFLDQGWNPCPL